MSSKGFAGFEGCPSRASRHVAGDAVSAWANWAAGAMERDAKVAERESMVDEREEKADLEVVYIRIDLLNDSTRLGLN